MKRSTYAVFNKICIFGLVLCIHAKLAASSSIHWNFAVTTSSRIIFYDEKWQEVIDAAHQFQQLNVLTYDEAEDKIYFNDRESHHNGSIYALKLNVLKQTPQQHLIDKIVHRFQNESITGLTYDPLNRVIYFADELSRKILLLPIDAAENQPPKVLLDFTSEATIPYGVAVDSCRRKLYFTNSNFTSATIERIDLDGSNREVIINKKLFSPRGIIVDQISDRIYYVVKQEGVFYSIESAKFDGSERLIITSGANSNEPRNIAVTQDTVFWTDRTYNAVWGHPKNDASNDVTTRRRQPDKVLTFDSEPRGIVARTQYLSVLQDDEACGGVVKKIKSRLLPVRNGNASEENEFESNFCLNAGDYIKKTKSCLCKLGFKGARCELQQCHNYCMHNGKCSMSKEGFAQCNCTAGYTGQRCERDVCSSYCFNADSCEIDSQGKPSCRCHDGFVGQRCEHNLTEICATFCRILKYEPDTTVPFGCHDNCDNFVDTLDPSSSSSTSTSATKSYQYCKNQTVQWNTTAITVLVCGVVLSLCLVAVIVHGLRRFHKPARPRIKKTFVLRKQTAAKGADGDTPLTNRPLATQQCEITIENCCNMNICETPCFDAKLMQQSLSAVEKETKEDKKVLIHNMEDELY